MNSQHRDVGERALVHVAWATAIAVLTLLPWYGRAQLPPPELGVATNLPTPTPSPSPDLETLARRQRLDQALEKIREAFARGDYRAVLTAVEVAELIEPGNPSVRLYREWAREKLAQAQIGTEADVLGNEGGTSRTVSAPGHLATPRPTITASPMVSMSPTPAQAQGTASPTRGMLSERLASNNMILGVVGAIVVVFGAVAAMMLKRRRPTAVQQIIEEESPSRTSAPAPAPPLESPLPTSVAEPGGIVNKTEPEVGGGTPLGTASPLGAGLSLPSASGLFGPTTPPSSGPVSEASEEQPARTEPDIPDLVPEDASFESYAEALSPSAPRPSPPEIVSFEDLGITLPTDEPPQAPEHQSHLSKSGSSYETSLEDSRIVIRPIGEKGSQSPTAESSVEKVPSQRSADLAASGSEPSELRFESSEPENASPEVPPSSPAVVPRDVPVIQLEDVLGEGMGAPSRSPTAESEAATVSELPTIELPVAEPKSKAAQPNAASTSPQVEELTFDSIAEGELDELSLPPKAVEDTTFHSKGEWTALQSSPPSADDRDEYLSKTRTVQIPLPDDSLAETRSLPGAEISPKHPEPQPARADVQSPYVAITPGASSKERTDDYSEKIFREQFERGIRALQENNFKQAVHFLSIAAAIRPDHEEVRAKLRQAREAKRRHEEQSSSR